MNEDSRAFEAAVWAAVEGGATDDQLARLDGDPVATLRTLDRLVGAAEERLESVRRIQGPERDQVVVDFEDDLAGLLAAYERWNTDAPPPAAELHERARLQASWSDGDVVVWAGGRGTAPATNDELADILEAVGGPALGWGLHAGVRLPDGGRAEAVTIPVADALGWLVAVGNGLGSDEVGPSVTWLGRIAVAAVRIVARGAVAPVLRTTARPGGKTLDAAVRWKPALVTDSELTAYAAAMPGPVAVLTSSSITPRTLAADVLAAIVNAIVADAAGRLDLPAPPPRTRTSADVAEAVATRLDGSTFPAPSAAGLDIARRLDRWSQAVTTVARPRLVVQLDPPDSSGAWLLSVLGPGPNRTLLPVELALAATKYTRPVADELARLERALPVLHRPGALRRGQVYLSGDEAWDLMTETGPALETAGFEVRVPALSRRKPSPALRLFVEPRGDTTVGANQLSNVRWSALFDDVELTAAEVSRLAAEARPLVQSHGKWVELDRVDLKEAAAALAERASTAQLTGAEILRHAVGLEGSALGSRLSVVGTGWASELLEKAAAVRAEPVAEPDGFVGELRSYQAEALGWLGFLDNAELGGCLALDMGLGKTPTVLAHLARTVGNGPALVIAPPAVVGNWAAEARRFSPKLRVVIHHGITRATAEELSGLVSRADVVITTYGTAVRDVDALAEQTWERVILDEAQAIKNPANETSQQLRRIPARRRLALTGTPIENGLGDLWSILDYTNPGLVGARATFVSQLAGEGEAALRALNGILVFRRTKSEPVVAAELPDRIDELDRCTMSKEQIGLYQAVLDGLVRDAAAVGGEAKQGAVLAAITALKQICNHPAAYQADDLPLAGRSGKLARLEEIIESVFAAGERLLVFTHFAEWGKKLADHLTAVTGVPIACYHGGLARGARDRLVADFQAGTGTGALVLSLKAGGTGLNLTAANHVVLYDRWWNPAVEDQAHDRAWRIGQTRTVVSHRLVCPGTVDERVEEVVAGKRHIADLVLPKSSSLADLDAEQLRVALGLRTDELLTEDDQ